VLRLVVRQTEGGENLDADLVGRAKAIIARYDQATTRGQRARSDPLPQGAFGMKSVRTEHTDIAETCAGRSERRYNQAPT